MSTRLERLLRMEHQIRKGAYPNLDTFCQMFDVQPRTVYEDLRVLRQMVGLEIVFDRARNGYFIENPEKTLPAFELTEDELTALALSKELLSRYSQRVFEPFLEGALDKIVQRNKCKTTLRLNELPSFLRVMDAQSAVPPRKVFIDLFRSWSEGTVASITYSIEKEEQIITASMEPRCLVLQAGAWYLVAFCRSSQALRVLPAQTISLVKNSRQRYDYSNVHDVDTFINLFFASERILNTQGEESC